jgi:hypothetical protein
MSKTMTVMAWSQRQARSITDIPNLISILSQLIQLSFRRHPELMDILRSKRSIEDLMAQANTAQRRNKAKMIQAFIEGVSYQRLKCKTEMVIMIDEAYTDKVWDFLYYHNRDLSHTIQIIRTVQQARKTETRPKYVHVLGPDGSVTTYDHSKIPLGIQKVMQRHPEMLSDIEPCESPPDIFLTSDDT